MNAESFFPSRFWSNPREKYALSQRLLIAIARSSIAMHSAVFSGEWFSGLRAMSQARNAW